MNKTPFASLSILIPAFNDAATIQSAVTEADAVGKRLARVYEIVVINDGSIDATGIILRQLVKTYSSLNIITHDVNQGYGNTIRELYYEGKFDWLFTIPGDYQIGAKELTKLVDYQDRGDMIIGWRSKRKDPLPRLVQSALYNILLRFLFRIKLHDVNSVRLVRRSLIHSLSLDSKSAFVDAELVIKAHRGGARILEVPIEHRERKEKGASGGKWWTIIPTIWEMLKFRLSV